MIRKEVQDEFKKLVESGKIDEKILYHPSFSNVFSHVIGNLIDYQNYSIRIEDNSIIAEVNYDRNNITDAQFNGIKGTKKYIIKMEKDNDKEYLTLKNEHANIDVYDNRSDNDLQYGSSIYAYDDRGYEMGKAEFYREQKVQKSYDVRYAFSNTWANPKLYVKCATRGFVDVPYDMKIGNDRWFLSTIRRDRGDGVAYKENIRYNGRQNIESTYAFGSISTERPYVLRSDNNFAEKIGYNGKWKDFHGVDISGEQLEYMIQEENQQFSNYSHRGR